jgi:hypothetical protein
VKRSRPRLTATLVPIAVGAAAAVVVAVLGGSPRPIQISAPMDGTLVPISAGLTVALGPMVRSPATPPVIVDCAGQHQVRPDQFVLTCADGNSQLQAMRWQNWRSSAYGTGTWWVNDCVPSCYQGHGHRFPALAVLWRPRVLPRHAGERYFTRLTLILPGRHCVTARRGPVCYPETQTTNLWSRGL